MELDYTDNMSDHLFPDEDAITLHFHPCSCGFVTVLESLADWRWTLQASEEASNELIHDRTKEGWMCQRQTMNHISKWTEGDEE